MAISAMEAAKIACHESGWTLSNLQLHKILYIAGMIFAGKNNGKPLINDENFQAWRHGPVLPSVYRAAAIYGSRSIETLSNKATIKTSKDSSEYREIALAVSKLKETPVFRLVEYTHSPKGAWHKRYNPGMNQPILNEDMVDEYRKRITG